jgi:hypothetical protein
MDVTVMSKAVKAFPELKIIEGRAGKNKCKAYLY